MNKGTDEIERRVAGFTIIELLLALAVLSLALTVLLPQMGLSRQRIKLRAAAVELASSLKLTRVSAQTTNADKILVLDTARRSYAAVGAVPTRSMGRDIALLVSADPSQSQLSTIAGFRFRPDGTSSGGQIKLSSAGQAAVVTVDWLTGAVSLKWQ